jgi:predicted RNase H-like HicB family nuclease
LIYKVASKKSEEGFAVWVPGLPGCASQGNTEEEALANIKDAIEGYLAALAHLQAESGSETRSVLVNVA